MASPVPTGEAGSRLFAHPARVALVSVVANVAVESKVKSRRLVIPVVDALSPSEISTILSSNRGGPDGNLSAVIGPIGSARLSRYLRRSRSWRYCSRESSVP